MTMRTVGVEEELLLVEPGTGQPLAVAETALRAAGQPEETELAAELQRQQLETNTTVCHDLGELARRQCDIDPHGFAGFLDADQKTHAVPEIGSAHDLVER